MFIERSAARIRLVRTLFVLLALLLLRTDEHEVEDREDRPVHENHLRDGCRRGGLQEGEAGEDGHGHDLVLLE